MVKLTVEHRLTDRDEEMLACFRQAYQSVRESIRGDEQIGWWATFRGDRAIGYREYRAFKVLSVHFAYLLSHSPRRVVKVGRLRLHLGRDRHPTLQESQRALQNVTRAGALGEAWYVRAEAEFRLPPVGEET
jgi:hypothetical protein